VLSVRIGTADYCSSSGLYPAVNYFDRRCLYDGMASFGGRPMLHVTVPNVPETLTYSVLAALGVDVLLAILLAVRGDWLAVLMVLAVAAIGYWFICRQLVAVVSADCAAAVSGILLFLCALSDFATDHPYYGLLFTIGALALAFVFVLLRQGAVPAELRVGGIPAVGAPNRAAHRRMLRELRDAGILTEDEFAAKQALLGL